MVINLQSIAEIFNGKFVTAVSFPRSPIPVSDSHHDPPSGHLIPDSSDSSAWMGTQHGTPPVLGNQQHSRYCSSGWQGTSKQGVL